MLYLRKYSVSKNGKNVVKKETWLIKSSQVNDITIGLNHSCSLKVLAAHTAPMFMTPPNPSTQLNPKAILTEDTLITNRFKF